MQLPVQVVKERSDTMLLMMLRMMLLTRLLLMMMEIHAISCAGGEGAQ
jgi:hypothetical protein